MTSFIIGRVVEPETRKIKVKGVDRQICSLGILSGRTCTQFDIFDDGKTFIKVSTLKDGDLVLAVIGVSVSDKGKLNCYLNAIGDCPKDLRSQLLSLTTQQAAQSVK